MKRTLFAALAVFSLLSAVQAEKDHKHMMKPYQGSAEFEQLKKLSGRWEGKDPHNKSGKDKMIVDYKVTSGGSALVETIAPGTPHEMVSIYSESKPGKVSMTHYCMLHNQPILALESTEGGVYKFDFSSRSQVSKKDMHMHSLSIEWKSPDSIMQSWTDWQNGKPHDTMVFTLARAGTTGKAPAKPAAKKK